MLDRGFEVGQNEATLGQQHSDVCALACDDDSTVVIVILAAQREVQQVVRKDYHFLKVGVTVVLQTTCFFEHFFNVDLVAALE